MLLDMSETDVELLARYTRQRAEDAFEELVRRHLGLVYSAALHQVRSPQLAEEVSQSVFTDLARNAAGLSHSQFAAHTRLQLWVERFFYFCLHRLDRSEGGEDRNRTA